MKKLNILKAIVDLVWIFTMPIILFIILFIPLLFIYDDLGSIDLEVINIALFSADTFGKFLISIVLLTYGLLIYCLFLFRKLLRYFINRKVFDEYVIKTFHKIGILLVISGVITLVISFVSRLHFQQEFKIEIGMNEHLVVLCLGLFFMVLSEIFRIAKTAKEENDLTI